MDDAQLHTVWQNRQPYDPVVPLAQPLTVLVKRALAKRVRQVGRLAAIWDEIIPDKIAAHTALEGLSRGTLRVLVDSAGHRYQLRALLDGGLFEAIRSRFGGALNSIRLIPGQFESIDLA